MHLLGNFDFNFNFWRAAKELRFLLERLRSGVAIHNECHSLAYQFVFQNVCDERQWARLGKFLLVQNLYYRIRTTDHMTKSPKIPKRSLVSQVSQFPEKTFSFNPFLLKDFRGASHSKQIRMAAEQDGRLRVWSEASIFAAVCLASTAWQLRFLQVRNTTSQSEVLTKAHPKFRWHERTNWSDLKFRF